MDLHPAIVTDSNYNQISYQQLSFQQRVVYSSDQNDEFAGQQIIFGNSNDNGNGGSGGLNTGNLGNIKSDDFWLKALAIKENFRVRKSSKVKSKRDIISSSTTRPPRRALSLFVEYLVVLDSTVYMDFVALYGSKISSFLMNQYINIYFCQIINGVQCNLKIFD